ncbi:MAG: cation transporter, partial [Cyanobacteria bacterium HKST-UBA05]|nr:cation transporter [Cyanobacteria bacterium HKST-UBA05]
MTPSLQTTPLTDTDARRSWLKIAFALMAATVLYNITEAVIALYYGWLANSVALVGFGFDSLIEMSASGLVLFQLLIQLKWNNPTLIEKSEHWVHRFVGATFFLLSAYILYEA